MRSSLLVRTGAGAAALAVAADLQGHVSTLETAINAINAIVTRSPKAGKDIEMAAMHMNGTAEVLAKGIVSAKGISGDVTSAPSSLRAALTGLLVQHVAAIVAGSPSEGSALQMAENHMAGTGAVLAQGIVASMPAKFMSS